MTIGATEFGPRIKPEVQIHAALFSQRGFFVALSALPREDADSFSICVRESRWPIRTGGQNPLEDDSDPLQSELPVFGASFALSCSPRLETGYL